jgi:ABC-2 type transport system ATP-binding protein
VASHLLGEIEQVCSFLLAIDAGRVLKAAPISTFTQRTSVLAVEVEEGADRLAAALMGRGFRAKQDEACVLIALEDEALYDAVRDAVADLGLPLVRIQQERRRLEDIFREAVPASAGAQ